MWKLENGKTVFTGGKNAYETAERAALQCVFFAEDCEEECVADEEISCYNCRYRRWTDKSFICMKGGLK